MVVIFVNVCYVLSARDINSLQQKKLFLKCCKKIQKRFPKNPIMGQRRVGGGWEGARWCVMGRLGEGGLCGEADDGAVQRGAHGVGCGIVEGEPAMQVGEHKRG